MTNYAMLDRLALIGRVKHGQVQPGLLHLAQQTALHRCAGQEEGILGSECSGDNPTQLPTEPNPVIL